MKEASQLRDLGNLPVPHRNENLYIRLFKRPQNKHNFNFDKFIAIVKKITIEYDDKR